MRCTPGLVSFVFYAYLLVTGASGYWSRLTRLWRRHDDLVLKSDKPRFLNVDFTSPNFCAGEQFAEKCAHKFSFRETGREKCTAWYDKERKCIIELKRTCVVQNKIGFENIVSEGELNDTVIALLVSRRVAERECRANRLNSKLSKLHAATDRAQQRACLANSQTDVFSHAADFVVEFVERSLQGDGGDPRERSLGERGRRDAASCFLMRSLLFEATMKVEELRIAVVDQTKGENCHSYLLDRTCSILDALPWMSTPRFLSTDFCRQVVQTFPSTCINLLDTDALKAYVKTSPRVPVAMAGLLNVFSYRRVVLGDAPAMTCREQKGLWMLVGNRFFTIRGYFKTSNTPQKYPFMHEIAIQVSSDVTLRLIGLNRTRNEELFRDKKGVTSVSMSCKSHTEFSSLAVYRNSTTGTARN